MPRSAGGIYSLPAGNPVVTLTVIQSSWANTTLSDIATALTGSLAVDGSSAMTGALRLANGTTATPALTFATETNSGLYRSGAGDIRFSMLGFDALQLKGIGSVATVNIADGTTTRSGLGFISEVSTGLIRPAAFSMSLQTNGVPLVQMVTNAGATAAHVTIQGISQSSSNPGLRVGDFNNNSSFLSIMGGAGTVGTNDLQLFQLVLNGDATIMNRAAAGGLLLGSGGSARVTLSSTGSFIIPSPVLSGNAALQVTGIVGGTVTTAAFFGTVNGAAILNCSDGTINVNTWTVTGAGQFGTLASHGLQLLTNSLARINILAGGQVSVNAPTAATGAVASLFVQGLTNTASMLVQGAGVAGQAQGILVYAGTTSADYSVRFRNQGNTVDYLMVRGDGQTQIVGGGTAVDTLVVAPGALAGFVGTLVATNSALANFSGAGAGTLANAPSAGSPSKWIGINDNGTLRKIPTWV